MYSVEQVAKLLGLHVKTVRGYVRDGRLNAVRIGKQYRISPEDLAAFTGAPKPARHLEASTIVQLDGTDRVEVDRLSTLLLAAAEGVRVEIVYDESRATVKIIILGGVAETAGLLNLVEVVTQDRR
ncbi:helix-turn-helix domain-containing protein [Nonomuraea sediminis]|uniref:helix-turn-helix domain-containing protein n=1 Tax=Nonomuraea sediminis TaxID=2835864 RepID=UPI001BDC7357|nr:helix-turn-helix domain-containing protein [Nonomuraea sediminis]